MKVFCIGMAASIGLALVVLGVAHAKRVFRIATVFLDHY